MNLRTKITDEFYVNGTRFKGFEKDNTFADFIGELLREIKYGDVVGIDYASKTKTISIFKGERYCNEDAIQSAIYQELVTNHKNIINKHLDYNMQLTGGCYKNYCGDKYDLCIRIKLK